MLHDACITITAEHEFEKKKNENPWKAYIYYYFQSAMVVVTMGTFNNKLFHRYERIFVQIDRLIEHICTYTDTSANVRETKNDTKQIEKTIEH